MNASNNNTIYAWLRTMGATIIAMMGSLTTRVNGMKIPPLLHIVYLYFLQASNQYPLSDAIIQELLNRYQQGEQQQEKREA
jgi:hypothetical protein